MKPPVNACSVPAEYGTLPPLHREQVSATHATARRLATFDFETRGRARGDGRKDSALYGDVCAWGICLYGNPANPDEPRPEFCATLADFLARVIASYAGFTLAAHNGAGYEFNYLLDPLRALVANQPGSGGREGASYAVETRHQGERIIGYILTETSQRVVTRGKNAGKVRDVVRRWEFLDTYPLFTLPLADVAQSFCPEIPKLHHDHRKEEWSYANRQHQAYLIRDCEIVFMAYRRLEARVSQVFSSRLAATAGGSALRAFVASIPDGHVYYRSHPVVESFVRRAYRGGLCLPGTTTKPQADMVALDMSGAYGYQMLHHNYPVGAPCRTREYLPGYTGVYSCYVTTPPDLPFGIIAEEKSGQYPLGRFHTVCTSVEIEYALTLGYSFEVDDGYYWVREEPVFVPFMQACEQLERDTTMKPVAKILRNALYGKFCTRPEGEQFMLLGPDEEQPLGSYVILDPKTGEEIPGLYSLPTVIDAPYIMPIWGTLITAYERVYLAQRAYALYEAGAASVYADTDSLMASRRSVELVRRQGLFDAPGGEALYGTWKLEAEAAQVIVYAPKVYTLLDSRGNVLRHRAKGLPLKQLAELGAFDPADFRAQVKRQYHYISSNSIRDRLLHPEKPIRLERKRVLSLMQHSPGWHYDARTGAIRPTILLQERREGKYTPINAAIAGIAAPHPGSGTSVPDASISGIITPASA